jgi:aspartyl-tRNA(Asn)/glutamyl-tRNA(Gln) amidotransferase subunit C
MTFSVQDTAKVARLARLAVTEEEKVIYAKEIGGILKWVEMLSSVDDASSQPVTSVSGESLPMREDVVTAGNQVNDILRNAPAREFDCFVVPKVIDQG